MFTKCVAPAEARTNSTHDMNEGPYFSAPPICKYRNFPTHRAITRLDNEAIRNAGRPFYVCNTNGCGQYYCLDDAGGTQDTNPACHCGRPSRRRIGAAAQYRSNYLLSQCAISACGFQEVEYDGSKNKAIAKNAIPAAVAVGRL